MITKVLNDNTEGWVFAAEVAIPDTVAVSKQQAEQMFDLLHEGDKSLIDEGQLLMWGQSVDFEANDVIGPEPHWLSTKNGVGMHQDMWNPQYVHCLKVYVDEGQYSTNGYGGKLKLHRGLFYIFDCHKKHAVVVDDNVIEDAYNVSIVIDSDELLSPEVALQGLVDYGENNSFSEGVEEYVSGEKQI